MNDADFSGGARARGHRCGGGGRTAPVKINAVVRRGINEHTVVDLARHFRRARGTSCASSSTWTSGTRNGWRLDDVVPGAEIVERMIDARDAARAGWRRTTAARSSQRWRYRDGGGEVGVITSVTQPFCGDCTRARLSAPRARSTPASSRRTARTCAPCCATARATTQTSRRAIAGVWARARRPLLGDPLAGDGGPAAASRCRTSAAEGSPHRSRRAQRGLRGRLHDERGWTTPTRRTGG